jgi:hypothetical protein
MSTAPSPADSFGTAGAASVVDFGASTTGTLDVGVDEGLEVVVTDADLLVCDPGAIVAMAD